MSSTENAVAPSRPTWLARLARAAATTLARSWPFSLAGPAEGSWRGPFFGIGEQGHTFELGPLEDGWQRNLSVVGSPEARFIPAAYACVMANARGISQCYPAHKRRDAAGRIETVTTSAAARVLRKPNGVETWPQFILNLVCDLQFDGNAMAVGVRNGRTELESLWRMPRTACAPMVGVDGSVFYSVGVNDLNPDATEMMAPASDVLHLRMYCPRHPLLGESPITAAAMAAGINVALSRSQLAFFSNMNRPSGVLSTEHPLTSSDIETLQIKMAEASKRWAMGGMPILSRGLKFQPLSISSVDAQLIEAQRLSIEDIARVYGVPLPVIGDLSKATLQNVEQLAGLWLAIGLGALLENLERSLDALFDLPADEWIELDTAALLRTDFLARVEGLTKAIQGGLMSPNEARARESLSPVAHGDTVYVQQQMVPLGGRPPAPAPAPGATPPADPAASDPAANDPNGGAAADGTEPPPNAPPPDPGTRQHVPLRDELEVEIARVVRTLTDDEALALLRASVTETEHAIARAKVGALMP
jgi:HK97 family phage portal protein